MLLSEATGKFLERSQNGAKGSRQGAAKHLKGGYCLTLLSEDTRKT